MSTKWLHRILSALLAFGLLQAAAQAESTQGAMVPVFEPEYSLTWDGGVINTDNRGAVPNVVDWNGDGIKDLLVGHYYYGNVYYFQNYGTNASPVFHDRAKLQADGVDIALTYG
jgi:hypothetical protein